MAARVLSFEHNPSSDINLRIPCTENNRIQCCRAIIAKTPDGGIELKRSQGIQADVIVGKGKTCILFYIKLVYPDVKPGACLESAPSNDLNTASLLGNDQIMDVLADPILRDAEACLHRKCKLLTRQHPEKISIVP